MKLKEQIIKDINRLNISELLTVQSVINNIRKRNVKTKGKMLSWEGAEKVRLALQGTNFADDLSDIREDRI
jgi:hypothetical protein